MAKVTHYGNVPFLTAVIHGGPGGGGDMAPVARELSVYLGVMEPIQSANSIQGQIDELLEILCRYGKQPFILIGHSWGAWLSFLTAAYAPDKVKKLILVGSPPFTSGYAETIFQTRMSRLLPDEQKEIRAISAALKDVSAGDQSGLFQRFGQLLSNADSFDSMCTDNESFSLNVDIYQRVWPEADALRRSGQLLNTAGSIHCPVVAIHGDYDPHPAAGVREPLTACLGDFRFRLLEKCGHKPWTEKWAKDRFWEILKEEVLQIEP